MFKQLTFLSIIAVAVFAKHSHHKRDEISTKDIYKPIEDKKVPTKSLNPQHAGEYLRGFSKGMYNMDVGDYSSCYEPTNFKIVSIL